MKNFTEFLKSLKNENTPEGDLARDFIQSKCKARTFAGVKKNLDRYKACDGAYRALKRVNTRYKNQEV